MSSRLPAKVLLDLGGKTALERCLSRVSRITHVADVVVATTDQSPDDVIVSIASRLGYRVARGSETDVLDRYLQAARGAQADVVIRCTSDCPLLDPTLSALVVDGFLASLGTRTPLDYASNTLTRQLPRGLDTEVFSRESLEHAAREASSTPEREHVTMRFYTKPDRYRCAEFIPPLAASLGDHRWTLDTIEDYRFLFHVYAALGSAADGASFEDILALLMSQPALSVINSEVRQKER